MPFPGLAPESTQRAEPLMQRTRDSESSLPSPGSGWGGVSTTATARSRGDASEASDSASEAASDPAWDADRRSAMSLARGLPPARLAVACGAGQQCAGNCAQSPGVSARRLQQRRRRTAPAGPRRRSAGGTPPCGAQLGSHQQWRLLASKPQWATSA